MPAASLTGPNSVFGVKHSRTPDHTIEQLTVQPNRAGYHAVVDFYAAGEAGAEFNEAVQFSTDQSRRDELAEYERDLANDPSTLKLSELTAIHEKAKAKFADSKDNAAAWSRKADEAITNDGNLDGPYDREVRQSLDMLRRDEKAVATVECALDQARNAQSVAREKLRHARRAAMLQRADEEKQARKVALVQAMDRELQGIAEAEELERLANALYGSGMANILT